MTNWLTLSLLALVALGGLAGAPVEGAGLDSLLTIAMRENPRLVSLGASWRAAQERVPQAAALPDPMLEWTAENAPLSQPGPWEASTQKIALSQMLMFPGKRGAMRSAMEADAEMAHQLFKRVRLEVAADLHNAYYDLYFLYESIDIYERNREALRAMAEMTRVKYEVGEAMQQDLLKANVELAMEANRLLVLRAKVPIAIARVNAILNRPQGATLAQPTLGDTTATWPALAQLEEIVLAQQPMLVMKDRAVSKGESDRRLAGKAGWPDFTVGVEYMAEREMPDAVTWMAGVNLPIWRGSRVNASKREAEQALTAARSDREQTKNEVLFMVRDAWTMVITMRAQVGLYRQSVLPQVESSLASTQMAYETNRVEFMSLLDAQRSFLQAKLMYKEALVDYMKSRAELGLAVGDPQLLEVDDE